MQGDSTQYIENQGKESLVKSLKTDAYILTRTVTTLPHQFRGDTFDSVLVTSVPNNT
jgi:hypothetical protein